MSDSGNNDNDELTEFIAQTLRAIGNGISSSGISQPMGPVGSEAFRMPQQVNFDIAITATHSKEGGGGLKVQVLGAGVEFGGKGGTENQTVSRVQFVVPWHYEGVFDRLSGPATSRSETSRYDELKEK